MVVDYPQVTATAMDKVLSSAVFGVKSDRCGIVRPALEASRLRRTTVHQLDQLAQLGYLIVQPAELVP
jgi:hypothetical protein